MGAASNLLRAVHERLGSDSAFTALIGDGTISDRLQERPKLPAVVMTDIESHDYSTATEDGEEHFLTIDLWGDGDSRKALLEISRRLRALLHEADLILGEGLHLVSLRLLDERAGREKQKSQHNIRLRFRAVSEAI